MKSKNFSSTPSVDQIFGDSDDSGVSDTNFDTMEIEDVEEEGQAMAGSGLDSADAAPGDDDVNPIPQSHESTATDVPDVPESFDDSYKEDANLDEASGRPNPEDPESATTAGDAAKVAAGSGSQKSKSEATAAHLTELQCKTEQDAWMLAETRLDNQQLSQKPAASASASEIKDTSSACPKSNTLSLVDGSMLKSAKAIALELAPDAVLTQAQKLYEELEDGNQSDESTSEDESDKDETETDSLKSSASAQEVKKSVLDALPKDSLQSKNLMMSTGTKSCVSGVTSINLDNENTDEKNKKVSLPSNADAISIENTEQAGCSGKNDENPWLQQSNSKKTISSISRNATKQKARASTLTDFDSRQQKRSEEDAEMLESNKAKTPDGGTKPVDQSKGDSTFVELSQKERIGGGRGYKLPYKRPVPEELLPGLARLVCEKYTSLEGMVLAFHTQHPNVSKRQIEFKIQEIAAKGISRRNRGEWVLRPEFEYLAAKEGPDTTGANIGGDSSDTAGSLKPKAPPRPEFKKMLAKEGPASTGANSGGGSSGTAGSPKPKAIPCPEFEHLLAKKDPVSTATNSGGDSSGTTASLKRKAPHGEGPFQQMASACSTESHKNLQAQAQASTASSLPPASIMPDAVLSGPSSEQDEDLPPTPRTAFEIYCDENRDHAKMRCQSQDSTELRSALNKMWARVPVDDREYYETQAENEETRYANALDAEADQETSDEKEKEASVSEKIFEFQSKAQNDIFLEREVGVAEEMGDETEKKIQEEDTLHQSHEDQHQHAKDGSISYSVLYQDENRLEHGVEDDRIISLDDVLNGSGNPPSDSEQQQNDSLSWNEDVSFEGENIETEDHGQEENIITNKLNQEVKSTGSKRGRGRPKRRGQKRILEKIYPFRTRRENEQSCCTTLEKAHAFRPRRENGLGRNHLTGKYAKRHRGSSRLKSSPKKPTGPQHPLMKISPKFPKGTRIKKVFKEHGGFYGSIMNVKKVKKGDLYRVKYEDGDSEDMFEEEIARWVLTEDEQVTTNALATAKRSHLQENSSQMKAIEDTVKQNPKASLFELLMSCTDQEPKPAQQIVRDKEAQKEEKEVETQTESNALVKLKQIAESWQTQTGMLMSHIDQCLEQEQVKGLLRQKKVEEMEDLNLEKQALQATITQQSEKISEMEKQLKGLGQKVLQISEMEKQLKGLNEKLIENRDIFKAIPELTDEDKLVSFSQHKLLALEQLLEKTVARVKEMKIELEKKSKNDSTCVVCMEAAKTVLLLPCKHLCLCVKCSEECLDSCPMCRNIIHDKMNIFTS